MVCISAPLSLSLYVFPLLIYVLGFTIYPKCQLDPADLHLADPMYLSIVSKPGLDVDLVFVVEITKKTEGGDSIRIGLKPHLKP